VKRMLADGRATAFVSNFTGQWLELRNLDRATPDPDKFPEFDEPLRTAMRREAELFFENLLREDRSILEMLDADYTFMNERLAKHYGIPNVQGSYFRKVTLPPNSPRGGLLGSRLRFGPGARLSGRRACRKRHALRRSHTVPPVASGRRLEAGYRRHLKIRADASKQRVLHACRSDLRSGWRHPLLRGQHAGC